MTLNLHTSFKRIFDPDKDFSRKIFYGLNLDLETWFNVPARPLPKDNL